MRRTFNALVTLPLLLATAAVCAAQAGGTGGAQNKDVAGKTDEQIIANERQVIEAIKNRNQSAFTALVDPSGWVVTPEGQAVISSVMGMIFDPAVTVTEYRMEGPKVLWIDNNAAVLTYKATSTGTAKGKAMTEVSQDSTVWHRRGGKWVAVFHQATPIPGNQPQGMPPQK